MRGAIYGSPAWGTFGSGPGPSQTRRFGAALIRAAQRCELGFLRGSDMGPSRPRTEGAPYAGYRTALADFSPFFTHSFVISTTRSPLGRGISPAGSSCRF